MFVLNICGTRNYEDVWMAERSHKHGIDNNIMKRIIISKNFRDDPTPEATVLAGVANFVTWASTGYITNTKRI